jgi:hypothetical protein
MGNYGSTDESTYCEPSLLVNAAGLRLFRESRGCHHSGLASGRFD